MQLHIQTPEARPDCFGKSWDSRDVLCAGGADPTYRDDKGSHVRPMCDYYKPCGAQVAAQRLEGQNQQLLAPHTLIRHQPQPTQAPTLSLPQHPMTTQQMQQAIAAQAQAMYSQMTTHQQRLPTWQPQPNPMMPMGYQQMMPVNYQMPAYLTVPEIVPQGGSVWSALGRSLFRSMGKSFGHTISHFFDATPFSIQRKE